MKRKMMLISMGLCSFLLLAGCSSSTGTYGKYVTLGEYKGLEVSMITAEVTDEELEEEISYLLEENAEYNDINDRAASEGDIVNIDYVGTIDGEEFDDGSAEDFELVLGEGYLLDDLEAGIVDMQIGETKTISLVFPDDYDEELGGLEATFSVTLNSIQEELLPEYDDSFVASISDFTTTAEYEEDLRESLLASKTSENRYTAGYDALALAISNATINGYPEDLYESSEQSYDEMNAYMAEVFGMEVSDLEGTDEEKQESIIEMVNETMVITAIAEAEDISVSDEEYTEYLESIYEDYDYTSAEEMEEDYSKEELMETILSEKVQEFLLENATITEISEDEYYEQYEEEDEDLDTEDTDLELDSLELDLEDTEEETDTEAAVTDTETPETETETADTGAVDTEAIESASE